jgi:hypothetical protein
MSESTPGPWMSRDGIITPADNDQIEIAEVFCESEGDYDENGIAGTARADGLLIAAAPDLLAALIELRKQINDFCIQYGEADFYTGDATKAIAKATGAPQ